MKTFQLLVKTNDSFAPLIARLTLGLVMFPHGAQKALGWFGGYGFSGTMNFFTQQMHIPAPLAFLAIAAEFAGSIGLILAEGESRQRTIRRTGNGSRESIQDAGCFWMEPRKLLRRNVTTGKQGKRGPKGSQVLSDSEVAK